MKIKSTIMIGALAISMNAYSQFFDSVPYRGAFGVSGGTRGTVAGYKGYDPDPTNTGADWTKPWANFAPNSTAYPGDPGYNHTNPQFPTLGTAAEKVVISSDIASDFTMTNDKWYELSGLIHVLSGATLTIEPGTCIRGSLSNLGGLIIAQGGKINAVATKDMPIVLTSGKATATRTRGDWAGLLILGKASTNLPGGQRRFEALPSDPLAMYGGVPANDADNSGTIRYMRVEFAGYNYLPDQEINGVTFGAIGSSSHFDYMQSSFSNDDAFEWFGGTSSHKYLIAFSGTDDDFDMDEGYRGNCQYLLGLRNAGLVETSPAGASNGLEHDNNTGLGTTAAVNPNIVAPIPTTSPTISNMTLVGPEKPGALKSSLSTLWQQRGGEALRLRTNDATGIFNSVVWGYATILNLNHPSTSITPSVHTRASDDELSIRNTTLISSGAPDLRLNFSNIPTTGWPTGVTPWTGLANEQAWIINGPATSVYNYTGATNNDTTRFSLTAGVEMMQPVYSGASNGALSQLDYTVLDFTLPATSPLLGTSSFQHPRVAIVAQPSVSVNTTSLPNFNQVIGTPSASKWIVIKSSSLTGGVLITPPAGFEISANGTTGWQSTPLTKGTTAADTIVYVRLNRTIAGTSNGFMPIVSTKTPAEFSVINVAVSGTAVAPATPYINASVNMLTFGNAVGAPGVSSVMVSGKNLTADITLTASANFEVSSNSTSGFSSTLTLAQSAGTVANTTVYVRYNPSAAGNHNGTLTLNSTNADVITIALNGNSAPAFTVTPSVVTAGGAATLQYPVMNIVAGTPSPAYPVVITGDRLTDTVKVNVPANFEMSLDSAFTTPVVSPATLYMNTTKAATLNQKIYVRYNAATATTNAGNMTIVSTGAPVTSSGPATQLVSLSGRAVAAGAKYITLMASSYQLKYSSVLGVPSAPQPIMVAGYNLGTDSVVVNAPANWEISLDGTNYTTVIKLAPNVGGTVAPTPVLVRYNPSVPMALNQFVIVNVSSAAPVPNSNTATNLVELVFGVATPTVASNLSSLPTFYTAVNKPSYANPVVVSGYNLTGNVTVTSSNGFQVSLDSTSFSTSVTVNQTAGIAASTKVYVRYLSSTAGSISGNYVNVNTQNGASIPVMVSAVAVLPALPVLNLSTANLTFTATSAGATAAQSFTLNAANLTDSLALSLGADFELSSDSANYKHSWKIAPDANGMIASTKVYVRFNRSTDGTSNDSLTFMSTGLTTQKIMLTGTRATVGIKEENTIDHFIMYPNPAAEHVNIEFTLDRSDVVSIDIYDLAGRTVKTVADRVNFAAGVNAADFSASDMQNGFYFVKIETASGSKTSRLLIAK